MSPSSTPNKRYFTLTNPFQITRIQAFEILDSRGNPTVQVDLFTSGGHGSATVPSGASTGKYEAVELRDNDPKRFQGKGVLKAVKNVETVIAKAIIGADSREQETIDELLLKLDGTPNKRHLGANAILAVSLAVAEAAANTAKQPLYQSIRSKSQYLLPVPMMNIINGAKHAGNQLAFQEFHVMPFGFSDFLRALQAGVEIYHTLRGVLVKKFGKMAINVGDEGGFAPPLSQNREAFDAIIEAIDQTGYKLGKQVGLAIDAAASEFFEAGKYLIDGNQVSSEKLHDYYCNLCQDYPIVSIEDPFEETDFEGFANLTTALGKDVQIVGDDIFVTNTHRFQKGIKMGAANALLLKVNQIGTLTEALQAADMAIDNQYGVVVSHRSGETKNTFIADLTVALSRGQIKTGAPARSDRTAKYNRLIKIAHELGSKGRYVGTDFRFPPIR
jgi:enolase